MNDQFSDAPSMTTRQLRPQESLEITMESPLILDTKRSIDFKNPVFSVVMDGFGVSIEADMATTNFQEMAAGRSDTGNNLAKSPDQVLNDLSDSRGTRLSNIGISLALTTTIDGTQYAVLSKRAHDDRYMLLSGYVDAGAFEQVALSSRGLIEANALKEGGEEFLLVGNRGLVSAGEVFGTLAANVASELLVGSPQSPLVPGQGISVPLGSQYTSLSYDRTSPVQLTHGSMPAFLNNVHPAGFMTIDQKPMHAGFQYAQQWNAGQIIVPFDVSMPALDSQYLFHAEDKLNPEDPSELITMLNRNGLVLVELDVQGKLTENHVALRNGLLEKLPTDNPETRVFSEAFAPSPVTGVRGFVAQENIAYKDISSAIRA